MRALVHIGSELTREIPRQVGGERRVHRVQRHVQPAGVGIGVAIAVGLGEQHDDLPFFEREGAVTDAQRGHRGDGVVLAREEAEEKANEIRVKTEHDFNLEKQTMVHSAKLKGEFARARDYSSPSSHLSSDPLSHIRAAILLHPIHSKRGLCS